MPQQVLQLECICLPLLLQLVICPPAKSPDFAYINFQLALLNLVQQQQHRLRWCCAAYRSKSVSTIVFMTQKLNEFQSNVMLLITRCYHTQRPWYSIAVNLNTKLQHSSTSNRFVLYKPELAHTYARRTSDLYALYIWDAIRPQAELVYAKSL